MFGGNGRKMPIVIACSLPDVVRACVYLYRFWRQWHGRKMCCCRIRAGRFWTSSVYLFSILCACGGPIRYRLSILWFIYFFIFARIGYSSRPQFLMEPQGGSARVFVLIPCHSAKFCDTQTVILSRSRVQVMFVSTYGGAYVCVAHARTKKMRLSMQIFDYYLSTHYESWKQRTSQRHAWLLSARVYASSFQHACVLVRASQNKGILALNNCFRQIEFDLFCFHVILNGIH